MTLPGTPASGKRRGRYAKSANTRRAILDAAFEVFRSGYKAGSLRDIARKIDMSEAGILHHFPSKRSLLLAVLEEQDELDPSRYGSQPDDPVDDLRSMITRTLHYASEPGAVELFQVIGAEAASPDHPAHDFFTNRHASSHDAISLTYERLLQAGRLRDHVDPDVAAMMTVALMDGLRTQWLFRPRSVDFTLTLACHFSALVNNFSLSEPST